MILFNKSLTPCLLATALFSMTTMGWAAQPDAGQILRQQQNPSPSLPNRLPEPEKNNPKTTEVPAKAKNKEASVKVRAFRFKGAENLVSDKELQTLVADNINQSLTFADLQKITTQVTNYLKNKGFLLTSAYLPKQEIQQGVVEITIVPGKLQSAIQVKGHQLRLEPARLQKIAQAAIPADAALRMEDLERAALLMNDLPGIGIQSQLVPGDQPGLTQWVIDATEGSLLSGNVSVDNYGNRYTGVNRINASVNLNDPLRKGDQLSAGLTHAIGLQSEQFNYSTPLMSNGLRGQLSASHLNFNVGQELIDINSTGSAQTKSVSVSYPWVRSRSLNVWLNGGHDWKFLKDKLSNTVTRDKQLSAWNAGISGNQYDQWQGGGLTNFSVTLTSGNLDLSNQADDLANDQATAGTDGGYTKIGYSAARLQRMTDRLAFFAALNGQYAGQNLDSSEKFILGGPSGVRAYPNGEGSGDRGEIVNLELRYDFIPKKLSHWGSWQLVTFLDAGQITLYDSPWNGAITSASGANTYTLKGAGLGLNLTHGSQYAVRAAWAKQIGSNLGESTAGLNADGKNKDGNIWIQALMWF